MKIAVVTGAGKGLGREIAKGLAAKRFTVLATDIDEEAARATAGAIGGGAWSHASGRPGSLLASRGRAGRG